MRLNAFDLFAWVQLIKEFENMLIFSANDFD